MASKFSSSLSFSILFVFLLSFCHIVLTYKTQKPQIDADSETILESGDNYTIVCQGSAPLDWAWPQDNLNFTSGTIVFVEKIIPTNHSFKYASRLFLFNLTYDFTGFYNCHNKYASPNDEDSSAKFYLYVKDDNHLSVSSDTVVTVTATQYGTAVMPCRPTSPDVNVQLTYINGDEIENATYDPKTGYKYYVEHFSDEGLYFCAFSRGDYNFELQIYLKVLQMIEDLPEPLLQELNDGHTVVGDDLILKCLVSTSVTVSAVWWTPNGRFDGSNERMQVSEASTTKDSLGGKNVFSQNFTIHNVTLEDRGIYMCNVSDKQDHFSFNTINVTIYGLNEHFISLTEENEIYDISTRAGETVLWRIMVKGHPEPYLSWWNNDNEIIPRGISSHYNTTFSSEETVLQIFDVSIADFGYYTLKAENKFGNHSRKLFLNVTDKPSVIIESKNFLMINKTEEIKCKAAAYPKPTIEWFIKNCEDDTCHFEKMNQQKTEENGLQIISRVAIKSSKSGRIKCLARNSLGRADTIHPYVVTDVEDGFNVFGFNSETNIDMANNKITVAEGEKTEMICGATIHNYSNKISWYHNSEFLLSDDRIQLESDLTSFSYRSNFLIENTRFGDGGTYSCTVHKNDKTIVSKNITLFVSQSYMPVINNTNMKSNLEMLLPNKLELFCNFWGVPKPKITWFKGQNIIQQSERILFRNENRRIFFKSTEKEDEGTYRCVVSNKQGSVFKETTLSFKNNEKKPVWMYAVIAVLVLFVIISCTLVVIKVRKERKLQRELKIAGLANFEEGATRNLNPDLGIDDQAELLPYDKKWEFPIDKLKLGKQLGSGAFGVVMKGVARGLIDGEESTTVAVKMVKKNAGYTYIKALASELKIMVHLGKHLNVVNLLGACTKNVAKRELLVIVEFCRFGNIQNYLLRHRDIFIDQVDSTTGRLDYLIGQEIIERAYSVSSNRSNPQSPHMKYAALAFSNSNSGSSQIPHDMADYRGNDYNCGVTGKTDTTLVSLSPNTDDEIVLSNNSSVQPEWRSNYRGDYKGNVRPICTKDLITWAFQISRGMEYLASRRVLHGDLAARNVLLADHNIVKICDFGLAKNMYKDNNYKKKGDGPLPVKWMAVESIRDKMFSTQSDVWSFGIVLWELFSLAKTPYPGMEADERLYIKLLDGYRMEAPSYAPNEMYKMMLDCWQAKPLERPSFEKLSEKIGLLLEDSVRKHYIDLNDPYLVMNTQRLEDGASDYLAMLSPPNFENLSSPHNYMNESSLPDEGSPGYLCMKPNNIFSPRPEDSNTFSFEVAEKNKKNRAEEEHKSELSPMLGEAIEMDNKSPSDHIVPNSFSNPIYHLRPKTQNDSKTVNDITNLLTNNYVNLPQSKQKILEHKLYTPVDKDSKYVNYTNSSTRDWESVKM